MIPKLVLKALIAAVKNPEVRGRVIAAASNPELRRQVLEAAGKGVESFRRWWTEREARLSSDAVEKPVPPQKASPRKGKRTGKATASRATRQKGNEE